MENLTFEINTLGHSTEPFVFTVSSEEQKQSALNNLDEHMTRAVLPVSILVAIGSVVGFFGNVMVIYVYMFHYKPCNFRIFVLWLGFVDLLSTMIPMPGEVITQMYWYTYPNVVICKIKSFSNMFTVAAEAMTLLVITIDRYLKACRPLGKQISIKLAKCVVIGIFLIAVMFSVPVPFFWGIHTENMTYENMEITVTICERDQKFINRSEQVTYSLSMQGILCLMMLTMSVLCVLIGRTLIMRPKHTVNDSRLRSPEIRVIQASVKEVRNNYDTNITPAETSTYISPDSDYQSESTSNTRLEFLKVKPIADEDISSNSANTSSIIEGAKYSESQKRTKEERHKKRPNVIKINTTEKRKNRVRSKTIIMFVLTLTFIVTTVLYLTLLSYITKGILKTLTDGQKTIYFFFFRLYFINHVINPIIYGALDPRFQAVITACWRTRTERFFHNS